MALRLYPSGARPVDAVWTRMWILPRVVRTRPRPGPTKSPSSDRTHPRRVCPPPVWQHAFRAESGPADHLVAVD